MFPLRTLSTTKRMVFCGLLVALGVILSGPLEIPLNFFGLYSVSLSFGTVPVILAAVYYGPMYGALVGGLWDLLQALLFPMGGYNPLFTLSGAVIGLLPGLFFTKGEKPTFLRVLAATAAGHIVGSVILNSLWMIVSYGTPLEVAAIRTLKGVVFIPLFASLVYLLSGALDRAFSNDQ
ncbi:MAG: folate family ECF transporter S component [Christensenellales bacterium]